MAELRGGHLSLQILQELSRGRFGELARERASRTIGDLQWRPAQSGSIYIDPRKNPRTTWHTGHVHALLCNGNVVVAGAVAGGVWLINPIPSPSFRDGYRAVPLSNRWQTPNVYSLAWGPEGTQHVYAGCQETDSLFLIELQEVVGELVATNSDLTIPLPLRTTVLSIVVLEDPRRIVIGTTGGAYWSDIPASPADTNGYAWNAVEGLPPRSSCSSLARGPGASIAAGADPGVLAPGAQPPSGHHGTLYAGDWTEEGLVFQPATVPEVAQSNASGFILASCASARHRMYATAMDGLEQIRCVLRSSDGGRNWEATGGIPPNAGERGAHNRAIGVSLYHENVVAIGWQAAGAFLSDDFGDSWTLLEGRPETDVHGQPCRGKASGLHSDLHDICFVPNVDQSDSMLIASDGGVIGTRDLGRCFDSEYNRALAVLQFYGPRTNGRPGTLSVSSRFPGLVSGGTQDNGNLALYPDSDAGSVWHKLIGGDGGMTRFVDGLSVLLHLTPDVPVQMSKWLGDDFERWPFENQPRDGSAKSKVVPKDFFRDTVGLRPSTLEAVLEPAWRRGGQLLYACAGTAEGYLYGLFASDDGTGIQFLRLGNAGEGISGVASLDGTEILVGCTDGSIRSFASDSGTWTPQPRDSGVEGVIRFEILSRDLAYALSFRQGTFSVTGTLLRFDGATWTTLVAEQQWVTFTLDRETGRLFAATTNDLFSSSDRGATWVDASVGLPAIPYCTDLRIGKDADSGSTLYLSTYGRSVWRAKITEPEKRPNFELPPQAQEILFGILEDGGGVVRVGGRLVRIPPRQPAADVLAGLAIAEITESMSPEASREIRRTTMQQLAAAIARALDQM